MKLNLLPTLALAAFGLCAGPLASAYAQDNQRPMLRVSSGQADNGTLDPDRATTTADLGVVSEIFNALVRFPPGSADPTKLEPDLAESWNVSDNGKVWTFHLRKGVQFHGGYGELTAADVVYSLERAADPKRSSFASNFAGVDKTEALDDYTVRVTLKYPDARFLGRVSDYHGGYIVSKKAAEKLGTQFGATPIGTGPFAFGEHITQQYVKLVANDKYYRGKPKVAGIIYRMIPSDSARQLAFDSGELDLIYGKREQRWVEQARKRGYGVDIFDPAEFRILHLNRHFKPLDNLKVRQAIAAAVDVDQIMKYVGKDVAAKGCSVVPDGYLGHDCSAGAYVHDVAKAKKLLAEAGYPNGIELKSIVSNISAQQPIMEIVQAQLAEAGIKLDMEVVDHATYQARSRKDQSAIVFYGAARFPNADAYLSEFFDSASEIGSPTAMSNFSHCSVADADIRAARIEPDPAKQLALWKDAQRKIHDDVCGVPLFGLKQVWVHSSKMHYGYDLKGSMNLAPPITEKTTLDTK
jgi:peptide/nickel transport system substrate-binding protein